MEKMDTCAADGAWLRLDELEIRSKGIISLQLEAFEDPFRDTYEAGVILPVLRTKGNAKIDLRCAALFFKRVLNDLRATWILLRTGYTSQSAAVAASLYENALATICLTVSKANIETFLGSPEGKIPWTPMEMAKMAILHEGKNPISKEYENGWRALYAHYVWLCQIKHPTVDSVVHDTTATTIASSDYLIIAFPNARIQDVGLKAMVAIDVLQRAHESIWAFAKALGFKETLPNDYRFRERFERAQEGAKNAFGIFENAYIPVNIAKTWFPKKYPPIP